MPNATSTEPNRIGSRRPPALWRRGSWGTGASRTPFRSKDNEHGDLVVTRLVGAADFNCKEIVFSVDTVDKKKALNRAFYTATVCQDGTVWKWASAEPATARWGSLQ